MLDDLLEVALELGGEVVEVVLEHMWEKKNSKRGARSESGETWDKAAKKPPWEG